MEDFNIPSAERVALLERLQEAMGDAPPYFWAACLICDLKALEKLVEHARIYPEMARIFAGQTYKMIVHWTQSTKGASQPSTPKKSLNFGSSPADSPPAKKQKTTDSPGSIVASSPVLRRSQAASASAKQRDGYRCVLTGDLSAEVAHIYPFCWLKINEEDIFGVQHTFWDCLKNFWPREKVTAWEAELFPGGISGIGIESVHNRITFSPSAHDYWNRGAFALKPISMSDDNTTLKVQFFWQKKQKDTQAAMSLLTTPFSTEDLDQNEGAFDTGIVRLFNCRDERIQSGDFFELKTDNAIARPLPSFQLLEMQWFLQRVVGMAGAAVPYEGHWVDEDSDDEISNLGLEEAGNDFHVFSDPDPQDSPPFLRKGSLLPDEGSKHHIEAATGDGLGDRYGGQEIM